MAIVRCEEHPVLLHSTGVINNHYVKRVNPVGYPDTAAICGRKRCSNPGLVWLNDEDYKNYRNGVRCFALKTTLVKIKVGEVISDVPKQYTNMIEEVQADE